MIYVIQAGLVGPFKIGYASEPQRRLAQLQTGNSERLKLIKVVRGDRSLEKKIHRDLVAFRKQGEWFSTASTTESDFRIVRLPKHLW